MLAARERPNMSVASASRKVKKVGTWRCAADLTNSVLSYLPVGMMSARSIALPDNGVTMCRDIKTPFSFEPLGAEEEICASSLAGFEARL